MNLSRRRVLGAIATTGLGTFAGCQQPGPEPTTETETTRVPRTPTPTPPSTTSATSTSTGEPTTEGDPSPTATPAATGDPTTFLSEVQIASVSEKLAEREQPWWSGYRVLLKDAKQTIGVSPMSVVDDGAPTAQVQANRFGTNCVNGECGSRYDYKAALRMSRWMRTLALAYRFSGRDEFARGAVDLLHHWFVAPETRMAPSGDNHGQTPFAIELHITIPAMIYAASLVEAHQHWDELDWDGRRVMREWIGQYLSDLENGSDVDDYRGVIENNIYAWWLAARATAATYLDDSQAFERVVEDWKANALEQVQPDGGLEYEKQRPDGLFYSIYGMKALFMTAELARQHDEDLYGYPDGDEPVLRRICDYHAPYVLEPRRWKWGLGDEGRLTDGEFEEAASVYEFAYSAWQDDSHAKVIRAYGRPIYDRRYLGWITLTHGNRFALNL